ncbi:hypothetical protein DH26_gp034 [Chloriridovirus anopheles1]|uniref:Uncharacterized protein n=1 Tax=Chloriridovirus anopheles1 TaxID=1465751 RepID=W8R9K7_9VIRU|nr:hypothetical protein DH26_gp034 [Anopheles minimus iridovirus]AHL67531.1 hypothetical protein AMIV_034 [Anopheles minimus iridovirus]
MKYADFRLLLSTLPTTDCVIGPDISIYISSRQIHFKNDKSFKTNLKRFIIFPIKIYGEKEYKHLNVGVLDNMTKVLTRFEPFGNYYQGVVDNLLESFFYKLMERGYIYFIKYAVSYSLKPQQLNNCGYYCFQFLKATVAKSLR